MAQLLSDNEGIKRLLRGTSSVGTCLVCDRGYVVRHNIPDAQGVVPPSIFEIYEDLNAEMIWRVLENRREYCFRLILSLIIKVYTVLDAVMKMIRSIFFIFVFGILVMLHLKYNQVQKIILTLLYFNRVVQTSAVTVIT